MSHVSESEMIICSIEIHRRDHRFSTGAPPRPTGDESRRMRAIDLIGGVVTAPDGRTAPAPAPSFNIRRRRPDS
ncbi:hypothetical protein EVAR_62983_1 [Eumeta japonica]|uniref:Uncharacterized protein n=1 Tax=Eumeta variegata TaxID=151549 RepID=A0A4C1ZRG0_EUMVA|nr:hypothetical protein EVAR_62983_1 [Eumeta japonica]